MTTCGAGLLASSWALTFCKPAVSDSICFCRRAFVAHAGVNEFQALSNSVSVGNPFKVGDRVLTRVLGAEVEAAVTKLWEHHVQVRTPDNELRWRTIYTVWYPGGSPLTATGETNR